MMSSRQICIGIQLTVAFVTCVDSQTKFSDWKQLYFESNICEYQKAACKAQIEACERYAKRDEFSVKIKEAIKVIHLYSHHEPEFYKELNNNCNVNAKLFSDFVHLLDTAIETIKKEVPKNWRQNITTYRGISTTVIRTNGRKGVNETWIETGYTSTSTRVSVALDTFSKYETFIKITNVEGLFIYDYSTIPGEYEVLIKRKSSYTIQKITNQAQEIRNEMNKVYRYPSTYPKLFYELEMILKQRTKRYATHDAQCFALVSAGINESKNLVVLPLLVFVLICFV